MSDVKEKSLYQGLLDAVLAQETPEGVTPFTPQAKGETRDAYLRRLVTAVAELTDENFKAMPEGSQEWFNRTVNDINAAPEGSPIVLPHLEGFDEEPPATGEKTDAKGEAAGDAKADGKAAEGAKADAKGGDGKAADADKPKGGRGRGRAAANKEGAPAQAAAPPAEKPAKAKGLVRLIREAVTNDPTITNDALTTFLKKNGVVEPKASSVALCRVDMLQALRVVRDLGKLAPDYPTIP